MEDHDEANDPVVRELDVFISQALSQQLFVLQYPHKPAHRPPPPPTAARVRPKHKTMELEYALSTDGPNYNKDNLQMKKALLSSERIQPAANYCIGAVRDGALHLTPVAAMVRMQPDFRHIDEAVEEIQLIEGSDDEDIAAAPKKLELQQIYKNKGKGKGGGGGGGGGGAPRPRATYADVRERLQRDPWVELAVHDAESERAYEEFERLFCPPGAGDRRFLDGAAAGGGGGGGGGEGGAEGGGGYLAQLDYRGEAAGEDAPPRTVDLTAELSTASAVSGRSGGGGGGGDAPPPPPSFGDKVAAALKEAGLASWAALRGSRLGKAGGPDALLRALMRDGALVRGNWALRSARLPRLTDAQVRARDAVLLLLRRDGAVSRPQLQRALGGFGGAFDRAGLEACLAEVAELNRARRRWELKLPDAWAFEEGFGAVAAEQGRQWAARARELAPLLAAIGDPEIEILGPMKKPTAPLSGPNKEDTKKHQMSFTRPSPAGNPRVDSKMQQHAPAIAGGEKQKKETAVERNDGLKQEQNRVDVKVDTEESTVKMDTDEGDKNEPLIKKEKPEDTRVNDNDEEDNKTSMKSNNDNPEAAANVGEVLGTFPTAKKKTGFKPKVKPKKKK